MTDTSSTSPKDSRGATRLASERLGYGVSAFDLVRYKKRCVDILGHAGGYDQELVSLCRAIRGM